MTIKTLMAGLVLSSMLAAGPAAIAAGGGSGGGSGGGGAGASAGGAAGGAAAGGVASGTSAGSGSGASSSSGGLMSGGTQGGNDIEPAQAAVQKQERAAGVAPAPAQNERQTAIVEQQVNKLISNSKAGIAALPPGSLPPSH